MGMPSSLNGVLIRVVSLLGVAFGTPKREVVNLPLIVAKTGAVLSSLLLFTAGTVAVVDADDIFKGVVAPPDSMG